MERLIQWLDDQIMYIKEAIEKGSATRHVITIWEYDHKNLLLVKEYITDYEKIVKDFEKLELEGRNIYEDMRMKYRANRRKWGVRLWR